MTLSTQLPSDCTLAGLVDWVLCDLIERNMLDREEYLVLHRSTLRPIVVDIVVSTLQRLSISLPASEQLLYAASRSPQDTIDPAVS